MLFLIQLNSQDKVHIYFWYAKHLHDMSFYFISAIKSLLMTYVFEFWFVSYI